MGAYTILHKWSTGSRRRQQIRKIPDSSTSYTLPNRTDYLSTIQLTIVAVGLQHQHDFQEEEEEEEMIQGNSRISQSYGTRFEVWKPIS